MMFCVGCDDGRDDGRTRLDRFVLRDLHRRCGRREDRERRRTCCRGLGHGRAFERIRRDRLDVIFLELRGLADDNE